jgi:hypothetical protein
MPLYMLVPTSVLVKIYMESGGGAWMELRENKHQVIKTKGIVVSDQARRSTEPPSTKGRDLFSLPFHCRADFIHGAEEVS